MERVYYIYEIPGVKIGCTQDFERRQKEQLSKGKMILLETHTDIDIASERERELQVEKGYPLDAQDYIFALKRQRLGVVASKTPEALAKISEKTKGRAMPWMHTPEAIKKRKRTRKKNYIPTTRSEEAKQNMSLAAKKRYKGKKPPQLHTKEVKLKRANANKKPVNQYTLDGEFIKRWDGAIDASRALNIDNVSLVLCCNGKYKTSAGFIWKYV